MKMLKKIYNLLIKSKNMALPLIYQIFAMIWSLIVPRLFLSTYGVSIHGLTSTITTIMEYVILLSGGIGMVAGQTLYGPLANKDYKRINSIYNAIRLTYRKVGIAYVIAIFSIAFVLPRVIGNEIDSLTVFLLMVIMGLNTVINNVFFCTNAALLQADNRFYVVNILYLIDTNVKNLIEFVLIKAGIDVQFVLLVPVISMSVISIIEQLYVDKYYPYLKVKEEPDYSALGKRKSGLIHQIAGLVVNSTDVIVLTVFTSQVVVSIYSVYSFVIVHIHNILNMVFSYGVVAKFGHLIAKDNENIKKIFDKYERAFYYLLAIIYGLVCSLLLPFVKLYASEIAGIEYRDIKLALLFIMVGFLNSARIPSLTLINAKGDFKETQKHALIEAGINLLISFGLVGLAGIYGVLIGTVVSFLYRSTQIIVYSNHKILKRSSAKSFVRLVFVCGIVLIEIVISQIIGLKTLNWWEWIRNALVYATVDLAITSVFFILEIKISRILCKKSQVY